jgi:3-oxoacyl-[acyl-carrier protein] reductase
MDLGLRGRTCVVTGASRGIGLATARALAEEGARVLAVSRRGDAEAGEPLALDVTDPGAPDAVLAAARGPVDVLVNNAGTSAVRARDDLTDAEWQEQWELNVMGPMRLMRGLAPSMAERGWGRIVNVSSSSGKRPSQTNVAYAVAKAAMLSLSRAWADAYAASGVLVNAVAPGPVGTELWLEPGGLADQHAGEGGSREQALAAAAAKVPLGRLGQPEEIAGVIVFLCSERAANVAGAAWSVDGGSVPVIL